MNASHTCRTASVRCGTLPNTGVYVLHFRESVGTSRHSARHYIGSSKDIMVRYRQHLYQPSKANPLVYAAGQIAVEQGLPPEHNVILARVIPVEAQHLRDVEYGRCKRRKNHAHFCPLCSQRAVAEMIEECYG